jgi:hypothetical protein
VVTLRGELLRSEEERIGEKKRHALILAGEMMRLD